MFATATLPLARPLLDTRPARGKHRTRRSIADIADRLLAGWQRARLESTIAAAGLGALAATVLS